MGLDMYAYALDAKLADDDWQCDFPVHRKARRAVGFLDLTDQELGKLDDSGKSNYWDKRNKADQSARDSGFFDPDFYYWRKFNALHGWMAELYTEKGGTDPDFNCNTLRLMPEDLRRLRFEIPELKPASGFFWGREDIDPDDIEELHKFLDKAEQAIADGKAIYYDSWW